ncbi:cytochrome bc1 complex diheme cytochrome c subunit [Jatrophihabitans fulvus]
MSKGHRVKDDSTRDIAVGDSDDELGFEPAVTTATPRAARVRRSRAGFRRRLTGSVVLLAALGAMGTLYSAFATSSGAESQANSSEDIARGKAIFQNSCISCHGANLEGVKGNGPSLIGTGGAATYFQVITGRMPVAAQGAYIDRKEPKFDEEQTRQLAAYVESVGGGPDVPSGNLRSSNKEMGKGGELFRTNCASCHGNTGAGAPLSAGKVAPSLHESTDKEIYTAMLSGPENMPVFSDNTLTPSEKHQIISYIQTLKASQDPGGAGLARIGPVSEGIVIWVAGVGALMIAILWIGARSR